MRTTTSDVATAPPVSADARRVGLRLVGLAAAAVLLGVYADVGAYAGGFWGLLPEMGTPWVLLAFAGGRVAPRGAVTSALAGSCLILVGLASYWAFMHLAYDVELYQYVGNGRGLSWSTMAVVLGTVAGLAGRSSAARTPRRAAAGWGFAVGVPLAEAARVLTSGGFPNADALAVVLMTTAAATTVVALREAPPLAPRARVPRVEHPRPDRLPRRPLSLSAVDRVTPDVARAARARRAAGQSACPDGRESGPWPDGLRAGGKGRVRTGVVPRGVKGPGRGGEADAPPKPAERCTGGRARRPGPGVRGPGRPGQAASSAFRIRVSETGCAVPSCWAQRLTRSSSNIHRTLRSPALGGLPSGSASTRWR